MRKGVLQGYFPSKHDTRLPGPAELANIRVLEKGAHHERAPTMPTRLMPIPRRKTHARKERANVHS